MNVSLLKTYFHVRTILLLVIITIAYVISGKLGLQLAFLNPSATPVWPPTGIALAVILLFGYRVAPAIFLGAFIVNFTTAGTIATSLGIALGNTLEALIGAYLVNRYANGRQAFDSVQGVFKFTVYAAVLAPAISATFGVTTLLLGGGVYLTTYFPVWSTWWLGDAGGALLLTPFLVIWSKGFNKEDLKLEKLFEITALLLCLLYVSEVVFRGFFPFPYICIPILVWIAFHFEQRGGVVAILVLSTSAIFHTLNGTGPFVKEAANPNGALLLLQMFLGTTAVMTLILEAALTERRRSQITLKNSENYFRSLIEKSMEGISLVDKHAKIIYTSPATEKILGYTPQEYVTLDPFLLIHPDDVKVVSEESAKLFKNPRSSLTFQYRVKHKNGTYVWLDVIGTNLLDDPSVNAVVANFRDITDRKHIEETITRKMAEDEALLSSIGDGIIATDKNGKIILVNKAFEDLLGLNEKDVIGKQTSEIFEMQDDKGNSIPEAKRPLALAIAARMKVKTTHYILSKGREKFPVSIVATPVISNNNIIGAVKVLHDITREKEIDRAKTEFVATASHQLRTPLGTVKWYLEAIMGEEYFKTLPQKGQEYIEQVYKSNERLLYIVRNLLSIARIDQGNVMDHPEEVDVSAVFSEVFELMKVDIAKKSLTLEFEKKELPHLIIDKKRFTEMIENLVSNATKYNRFQGTISVSFLVADQSLEIRIADTGIGINEKDNEKIFSKFYRAENAVKSDTVGSGLGLYLVKSYVEGWKGDIWFESVEGKGTTIHIRLPLGSSEVLRKILIVEDELPLLQILSDTFKKEGFDVSTAEDGVAGLQLAKEKHPDLILLDIIMPKMDGMTMLRNLRNDEWGKQVNVIVLTNTNDSQNISESMELKVSEFWVKSDRNLNEFVKIVKEKLGVIQKINKGTNN